MSIIFRAARTVEAINNYLRDVAYILVGVEAAFVVVSIFLRYVLASPLKAGTEIQQMIMVLATFLGTAGVFNAKGHVHVDFFIDQIKPIPRAIFRGLAYVFLGVPYCVLLVYFVSLFVLSSYEAYEHTQAGIIILWPVKSIFLFGFCMLGLQLLITGIRDIYQGITGTVPAEGKESHG